MSLKSVIPWRVRNAFAVRHQRTVLGRTVQRVVQSRSNELSDTALERLHYGWGNAAWSADTILLRTVCDAVKSTHGPILECGSGLTTIVMASLIRDADRSIWSLEHNARWHRRVSTDLQWVGLETNLCLTRLRDYGDFSWYDVAELDIPSEIGLAICDGPPSSTPGARTGLLDVMFDKLANNCRILVDDIRRPEEQAMVRAWREQYGAALVVEEKHPTHCILRVVREG